MGSFTQDLRSSLFSELLDADKFDLVALGRAAQDGVPEVKGLRAQVWKVSHALGMGSIARDSGHCDHGCAAGKLAHPPLL